MHTFTTSHFLCGVEWIICRVLLLSVAEFACVNELLLHWEFYRDHSSSSMASFSQPQFLSSLTPINKNNFTPSLQLKSFTTSKTSKIQSSNAESSPNPEQDPVKLALAKAKSYKNSVKSGVPAPKIVQTPEFGEEKDNFKQIEDGGVETDVPLAVDNAKQYEQSKILAENEGVASDAESGGDSVGGKEIPLSVKLALEKAKEYKKKTGDDNGGVADSQNLVSGTFLLLDY